MIGDYLQILKPRSILDVVDESILHSLMQGFFFRQKSGLVMLYDSPQPVPCGLPYHLLSPFPGDDPRNKESFNPFCALFRIERRRDALCENCDVEHARPLFNNKQGIETCYACHIGLLDFRFPIHLGDDVRAVMLCGQRFPMWDRNRLNIISDRVKTEAPELEAELVALRDESGHTAADTEELKMQFEAFGQTVQKTVTAIYEAKRSQAMQQAIVEVNEILSRDVAQVDQSWIRSAERVFDALAPHIGNMPIGFFVRRGSRYVATALSRALRGETLPNFPVAPVVRHPADRWIEVERDGEAFRSWRSLVDAGTNSSLHVFRVGTVGRADSVLPALLVVSGPLRPGVNELLGAIARAIAHQASVGSLLDRMAQQQEEFEREVAFTAHSMKTPIQSALFQVRKLRRAARGIPLSAEEAGELATRIGDELTLAIHDARQLQFATRDMRHPVSIRTVLTELVARFEVIAIDQGISIRFEPDTDGADKVWGEESQLRVALSNILHNAIKYSFQREYVRVRTKCIDGCELLIEISNIGVGFDHEVKDKLFEFRGRSNTLDPRRDRHGGGIGLHQAKEYLEDHGGSLDIESRRQERGDSASRAHLTTVTITLPLHRNS
jgi:signal transduction histidine kinase/ligand-binding sensor protein